MILFKINLLIEKPQARYDYLKNLPDDALDLVQDQYDLGNKERDRFVKSSTASSKPSNNSRWYAR